jgi:tRNA-Thr(GGU) m(6)t(6)A37 methyltransferase TsaA
VPLFLLGRNWPGQAPCTTTARRALRRLCYHVFIMSVQQESVVFHPIGLVRNGVLQTPRQPDWHLDTVSELLIAAKWAVGLEGVEDFSHIIVLFWFDRILEEVVPLKVHPMHREDLPLTGLFATRAPNRPNRVGLTVVQVLGRNDNVIRVKGLDALDGTPVLDIKPYLRSGELVPDATEPPWVREDHV